jgi:hypothetical protein
MAERIRALSLVLSELGIPPQIATVEDRLILQKAVYLAQTKVSLGYSYGWYLKGPYSPGLTQDYYELAGRDEALELGGALKASVRDALAPVRALIQNKPAAVPVAHWLELLASLHYLARRSGFSVAAAIAKIHETKPHLAGSVDAGVEALQL